jgi:hypothetical protein
MNIMCDVVNAKIVKKCVVAKKEITTAQVKGSGDCKKPD